MEAREERTVWISSEGPEWDWREAWSMAAAGRERGERAELAIRIWL